MSRPEFLLLGLEQFRAGMLYFVESTYLVILLSVERIWMTSHSSYPCLWDGDGLQFWEIYSQGYWSLILLHMDAKARGARASGGIRVDRWNQAAAGLQVLMFFLHNLICYSSIRHDVVWLSCGTQMVYQRLFKKNLFARKRCGLWISDGLVLVHVT